MPENYGIGEMLPGITGKVTLAIARRNIGFKLFEAAVNNPDQRGPLLDAYEKCLQQNRRGTLVTAAETFRALHLVTPLEPQVPQSPEAEVFVAQITKN